MDDTQKAVAAAVLPSASPGPVIDPADVERQAFRALSQVQGAISLLGQIIDTLRSQIPVQGNGKK